MTVFKKYMKIASTYTKTIIIYSAIFIGIAIFASSQGNGSNDYKRTDVKIAIINRDEDSKFIKDFKEYIDSYGEIVSLDDNEESLRDALFYRTVDYIMIIPSNYTNDFMNGTISELETLEVPNSYGSIYSKSILNKYLNTARTYVKAGLNEDEFSNLVKEDLNKKVEIDLLETQSNTDLSSVASYFNFANYMLITITFVVVTMIMVSFNEDKIKRRNLISPINYKSFNTQLLLGNCVVGLLIWLLYVVFSFILYFNAMYSFNGLLFILNSFVLMLFILAFSFMISSITSNREILSGVGNVCGLGASFICGAFVPQSMLSSFVLTLAKFLPSYWFIKANNEISNLASFDVNSIKFVLFDMFIVCIFTLVVYLLTQFIARLHLKK